MKRNLFTLLIGVAFVVGATAVTSCRNSSTRAEAGPYGGDLVPLGSGQGQAELLANADSGELMVHTWDDDLETPKPIASQPITAGSEDQSVTLDPHPLPTDPPGYCSRFYGQADWVRGGGVHHGWICVSGTDASRRDFGWNRCWGGGRQHGEMWNQMRQHGPGMHRRGMGGMGPGAGQMGDGTSLPQEPN